MPENAGDQLERYYAKDRQEWRDWLEKNHATAPGVWLISYKQHSGMPSVAYGDAVEEALCFGWIDSRAGTLDDGRHIQMFTPRKPKSPWSRPNKQRIEKLMQQGLMTDAGLAKIEAAKRDGSWELLDAIEDLKVPADLEGALAANEVARQHFDAFSNSSKKRILWWIESAKRPETRQNRIQETVTLAAQNIKAHQ
jgi:uncharacterized protein YdeI (YjbR/CyaY-like superfamily)